MTKATKAKALAAKALLHTDRASKTGDGKSFIPTDGVSVHFWHLTPLSWRAATDRTLREHIGVISAWSCMALAIVTEWVSWLVMFGRRRPLSLN